jgi:hypothetical protein
MANIDGVDNTVTVGENSNLQPDSKNPSITLVEVKREISQELSKAKEEFLKTAKKEAEEEIRKQVQTDKASLITVFGIFASIISFLTIEFQFLRTICSLEKLTGFTLILASLLLCFNLALDYLVKSRTDKESPKPNIFFSVFIAILFAIGIWFIYQGNEEKCKDNKIYEKYSESFINQQSDFNEKYLNQENRTFNDLMKRINTVEQKIIN